MSSKGTVTNVEKPFWLQSPWMILFDLIKLHKVKPWDVNISYLLTSLLTEMRRRGYIDFTASGIALLSSATIFKMKTELVLKLEVPPIPPPPKIPEFLPPPIRLPFRYEYTTTTIEQLLKSLEEALKEEPAIAERLKLQPIALPPPALPALDQFMVEIEEQIDNMLIKITELATETKYIAFSKLIAGLKRLDAVRTLIVVLFLACRGQIQLWQEEEFGEIYISLLEGGLRIGGTTPTGIV